MMLMSSAVWLHVAAWCGVRGAAVLRHHVLGDVVLGGRGGALRPVPAARAGHGHALARRPRCLPRRVRTLPRFRHQVPRLQPVHRGQRPRRLRELQTRVSQMALQNH